MTDLPTINVILYGRGGELDRRAVCCEEDINDALIDLARHCVFADGDTIRIVQEVVP